MKTLLLHLCLAFGIVCSLGSIPQTLIRDCHVAILELNFVYSLSEQELPRVKWTPYLKQWIGWVCDIDGVIRVDWWLYYQNEQLYKTAEGKYILYPKNTNVRIIADHMREIHTNYDREVYDRTAHPIRRIGLDPPEIVLKQYDNPLMLPHGDF